MAFVVSAGQLANVDRAPQPAFPMSVRLSDTLYQSYETIWRTQPQLRTVVGFLARNIAQLGLHVFERDSDTDRTRLTEHPLAKLMTRPLPPEFKVTRYKLFNSLVHDLGIYDEAYWIKVKAAPGRQLGLVRIPPRMIRPIGDNWFRPEGYEIQGRIRREFAVDQVVHFHGYNPEDPRLGQSPIETLRQSLAEEHAANRFREQMWRNGARTSGYIERPIEAPDWSEKAFDRFKGDWRSQYTGEGPETGGTPILQDGMKYKDASISPDQAQYLEARKLTREEIAAFYHIPPPMVGILDNATFSNITEQHKMLYQDTLGPWLVMLEEDIELQLLPDLDSSGDVYVEFNISEKLKGSFDEQAKAMNMAVGGPWMTRNEGRARQNLNAIDGGDELITPLNVLIGGQASPQDSVPDDENNGFGEMSAVLASFFQRQGKAVKSKVGAGKDWWDGDRWDRELGSDLKPHVGALASVMAASINADTKTRIEAALNEGGGTNVDVAFTTAATAAIERTRHSVDLLKQIQA